MLGVFGGQSFEAGKGVIVIQVENLVEADSGLLQETPGCADSQPEVGSKPALRERSRPGKRATRRTVWKSVAFCDPNGLPEWLSGTVQSTTVLF